MASAPEDLRNLLDWRPRDGVLSVCIEIDPADRGEGWRTDLRNHVADLARPDDHGARRALEATVERLWNRFPDDSLPRGRTHVGFLEVAEKAGREEWTAAQLRSGATRVWHASRPVLEPLVALLNEGPPHGVAAVSAERFRLWRWELGLMEDVDSWELEIFEGDWRERKAPRPADPSRVQGAASSGRDQYAQRLEHNRERFLKQAGALAAQRLSGVPVLAFGDAEHVGEFATGGGDRVIHAGEQNLISAPLEEVEEQVGAVIEQRSREQGRELVERVRNEAAGGVRAAVGAEETMQALGEGRVEHLVYDPGVAFEPQVADFGDVDEVPARERMIELAIATSARISPVGGAAEAGLGEAGGVAALLRY